MREICAIWPRPINPFAARPARWRPPRTLLDHRAERNGGSAGGVAVLQLLGRRLAVAGVAVLGAVAVAGLAAAIYAAVLFHSMPDAADLIDYHPPTAARVYAWDGTLIGEFSKVRRIYVPYDQMPPRLTYAFL